MFPHNCAFQMVWTVQQIVSLRLTLTKPQNNCEVIITYFANVEYEGWIQNGYKTMLQADASQFQDDW